MNQRRESLLPGSSPGHHYLEVYFTVLFLELGQFEAWKDPGQKKVGKSLSFVSNLTQFSLQTGSFVTRETSKEEVGH